jgi:site-specific recombinase XerD
MSDLASHLERFLREYLPRDRRASVHTCDSYAYAFQLLVSFAARRLKRQPSSLELEQLDAPLVLAFLEHIETERHNLPQSRNARLVAIKAFFRFLEYRLPSCLDQSRRIHAIPAKKTDEKVMDYLTNDEVQVLVDMPDPRTQQGIRDRAMLHLAFAAGLRVSELVGVRADELELGVSPSIHVRGKGRRERVLPLWKETASALREWLVVRGTSPSQEVFLNARGGAMTRSGFEYILAAHVEAAARKCPSLSQKRISPHSLRRSCAMHILMSTRDIRKVSLWLGHANLKSTEIYLRSDPTEKLEALMLTTPPTLRRGRFRAPDKLLAMLKPVKHVARYAER